MVPITALIHAYNEEEQLPRLFESLKGIDEIVLIDHLSTDKTAELAESLGAKVIKRGWIVDTVTEEDVSSFEQRYGYKPTFTVGNTVYHGARETQETIDKYTSNDWIFFPSCDEIVTWDLPKLKKIMPNYDIIACRFNHTHKPDNSPDYWFYATKLFRKSKTWWEGRIHDTITGDSPRVYQATEDVMTMDHWQVPKEYRQMYLPVLEYAALKEGGSRDLFYLAREYYNYQMYERAVQFFKMYFRIAFNKEEIYRGHTLLASALWELGREEEAFVYCMQAIKMLPDTREAYELMAKMSRPSEAKVWRKIAGVVSEGEHYI